MCEHTVLIELLSEMIPAFSVSKHINNGLFEILIVLSESFTMLKVALVGWCSVTSFVVLLLHDSLSSSFAVLCSIFIDLCVVLDIRVVVAKGIVAAHFLVEQS